MSWIEQWRSKSTDELGVLGGLLMAFQLVVRGEYRDGHETKCSDYGFEHQSTDAWLEPKKL